MALNQDQDMANNTTSTLPSRPATNQASQSNPSKPNGAREDTKMTSDDASESHSDDDESSSEAESSSDNDSTSEEDDNAEIPTLKPGVKPDFSSARKLTAGAPSLQDRLKAFLPQLAEANSKLAQSGASMEDVKEDEPHIEMDLGLGVLEEKREGEESEDDDEDEGMDGEEKERKRKEKDVMSELMGRKGENATKGIQEVE